jgi:ABC-type nickel/cobalt efflux system permease component RcnA
MKMLKKNKKRFLLLGLFSSGIVFFLMFSIFWTAKADAAGGIVPCGTGQTMCTLCDLIKGINNIVQYLLRIAIGLALTIFTVAGVMYIVSVGDSGTIETAKGAMKNAAIGFVVILAAWLMVNTLLLVIGANSNLGVAGVTSWGNFDCTASN